MFISRTGIWPSTLCPQKYSTQVQAGWLTLAATSFDCLIYVYSYQTDTSSSPYRLLTNTPLGSSPRQLIVGSKLDSLFQQHPSDKTDLHKHDHWWFDVVMIRLERWSIFDSDAMPMFFYNNDAMSMFLAISYHRNRCDYFWSTIRTDFFPMVFPF